MATSVLLPTSVLFIVLLASTFCACVKESLKYPPTVKVYNEQPCLTNGGICLLKEECPEGSLSNTTGLCQEQSENGVECCHGISVNERSCRGLGGECVTFRCPKHLTKDIAEDCITGEKCCVLVL